MTVEELMEALNIIENKNVPVLIDVESGTFPYHLVDIEGVSQYENEVDEEEPCIITIDHKVMRKVHPSQTKRKL